jgi:hypothetical protein
MAVLVDGLSFYKLPLLIPGIRIVLLQVQSIMKSILLL